VGAWSIGTPAQHCVYALPYYDVLPCARNRDPYSTRTLCQAFSVPTHRHTDVLTTLRHTNANGCTVAQVGLSSTTLRCAERLSVERTTYVMRTGPSSAFLTIRPGLCHLAVPLCGMWCVGLIAARSGWGLGLPETRLDEWRGDKVTRGDAATGRDPAH
jgi:hypothetical protein